MSSGLCHGPCLASELLSVPIALFEQMPGEPHEVVTAPVYTRYVCAITR